MKKNSKKLRLCRETVSLLTLDRNQVAAGAKDPSILVCPPPPLTTDSVMACCADD